MLTLLLTMIIILKVNTNYIMFSLFGNILKMFFLKIIYDELEKLRYRAMRLHKFEDYKLYLISLFYSTLTVEQKVTQP